MNKLTTTKSLPIKSDKNLAMNTLPVVSNGSIDAYITFVNSIPLLTDQEELDLAKRWHENEDVEAARYLVLSHLRLVVSIARGYLGYGLPLADIIQEGTIGLMKAVKRFNPARNVRLVTFAMHWIRAEINDFVIKNWRIVKTVTTKNHRKLFFNLRQLRDDIGNLSDVEAERIAKELNVSKHDVVDMNMRLTGGDVGIMADNSDELAPIDWLTDSDHEPEQIIAQKAQDRLYTDGIREALEILDERSREIIKARWLKDEDEQDKLHTLAERFGVSAERIRQIEQKAMQKMKQYLESFEPS